MVQILKELLQSDAGSFGFVFAFICLMIWVIWKVSHFNTKFGAVGKIEDSIGKLNENISYIKGSIRQIQESNNPLAQRQSPVSLTEKGQAFYEELEIEKMIINHWEVLKKAVEKQLPDDCNPYDIQEVTFSIARSFSKYLTDEELSKIKKHAFNSGLNLDQYYPLLGVPLRDKVLKDKGYKPEDVDKHQPDEK